MSFYPGSSGDSPAEGKPAPAMNFIDGLRASVNSDGYEASWGSGDDTSDAAGLSQSWNKASWSKLSLKNPQGLVTPAVQVPVFGTDYKEENVKPWVTFTAGTVKQDAKDSPGCKCPNFVIVLLALAEHKKTIQGCFLHVVSMRGFALVEYSGLGFRVHSYPAV